MSSKDKLQELISSIFGCDIMYYQDKEHEEVIKLYWDLMKDLDVLEEKAKLMKLQERALKEGIWVKSPWGDQSEIEYHHVRSYTKDDITIISNICEYAECDSDVKIADHGVWWAFTREELEND